MRKTEQRLWDTMKRNAPPGFWLRRIENEVGEGEPDVLAMVKPFGERWVELKATTRPARPTTRLLNHDSRLRPSQRAWHKKAHSYGATSFVLIRDDCGNLYLLPGRLALEINEMTVAEVEDENIAETWAQIFDTIRGARR